MSSPTTQPTHSTVELPVTETECIHETDHLRHELLGEDGKLLAESLNSANADGGGRVECWWGGGEDTKLEEGRKSGLESVEHVLWEG